jgi:hypothetical protein
VHCERALADAFELPILHAVAEIHQPLVEERVRRGEHDRAVNVVLALQVRMVADAHGPHATVAAQRRHRPFRHLGVARQGVERRDVALAAAGNDAVDEAQVAFHGMRRAEAVERLDDEVAVAQPAVAVIPVAAAARALGHRGGERGEHGAGVLVGAQLERDRRADHRLLPFERDRESPHPVVPVIARFVEE